MFKHKEKISITINYPTSIIQDFLSFLEYIDHHSVKLTKTKKYLTRKDLVGLYALMSNPKLDVPVKTNQSGYPLLNLFFHLAQKLGLVRIKSRGSGMSADINQERLQEFKRLTSSEQYVTLLECFWLKADWEELQGGYFNRAPSNVDFLFESLEDYPINKEIKVDDNLQEILYDFEHFLYYFTYFGFWKVVIDEDRSKEVSVNHHAAKSISLTLLFDILREPLLETWEHNTDYMVALEELFHIFSQTPISDEFKDQLEEDYEKELLFSLLQPLFEEGELKQTLVPMEEVGVAGKYKFKVSIHKSCWRTIQLSDSHTLFDLHTLIQKAFEFNDDHLYSFYMDGKKYSKNAYNSPMDTTGPFVQDVKIGCLSLYESQKFLYLFDFGDEWEFQIDVLEINEGENKVKALVCESKGEAPLFNMVNSGCHCDTPKKAEGQVPRPIKDL